MRLSSSLIVIAMLSACSEQPRANANPSNASAGNAIVADRGNAAATSPLTLKAVDGVTVYGTLYTAPKPKAVILLFHQAGSSKDEYATIAPRLVAAGYSALAIDQRSGGALYGPNETAAHVSGKPGYLAAAQDLQAAVDWAQAQNLPVVIWGSSYSSSLVFPLAVKNAGKIKGVLAFSPGEYFDDTHLVETAAARLTVPVYITSAPDAEEVAAAKAIADAVPAGLAMRYVPTSGVHGASTLIAAKDAKGAEANWLPVLSFLKKIAP